MNFLYYLLHGGVELLGPQAGMRRRAVDHQLPGARAIICHHGVKQIDEVTAIFAVQTGRESGVDEDYFELLVAIVGDFGH